MEVYDRFGVSVAVENIEGRYLLIRRSPTDSSPLLLEFPGGKAEFGEDFKAAAFREVKEETNLELLNFIKIGKYKRLMRDGKRLIDIVLLYSNSYNGEVRLSNEHSEYKWLDERDIEKKILSPRSYEVADDVKKFFELKRRKFQGRT